MPSESRDKPTAPRPIPVREPAAGVGATPALPTPVRASLDSSQGASTSVSEKGRRVEVGFEANGRHWLACERGRALAGGALTGARLLLVSFHRADEEAGDGEEGDTDGDDALETLLVARSLDGLTERELQAALERARPPREPRSGGGIFESTTTRGRGRER